MTPETLFPAKRLKRARLYNRIMPTNSIIEALKESPTKLQRVFLCIWSVIGAALLVWLLGFLLHVLSIPVSIMLWMLVFIFCLRPIVNALERRGINRGLGTAIAYVVMFLVLSAVGFLMFSPVFGLNGQFNDLFSSIPQYITQITHWANGFYNDHLDVFENTAIKDMADSVNASIYSWASSIATNAASAIVNVGTGLVSFFTVVGFALVIAFWVLMELPGIGREAKRIINPKHYEDMHFLHITFTRILGGYIKGMLIQCLLIGVVCGVLFAIAGVPYAPAMGVIAGILNIIPIIGPWLGGAAAAIMVVFVNPLVALIVFVGTIVIQQFIYTFISPKIMSSSVNIHPALTLVAMILGSAIGAAMSGILGSLVGMLLAIPAVAVLKACFIYYFEKYTGRQIVAADGVFFEGKPKADGVIDPFSDAIALEAEPSQAKKAAERKGGEGAEGAEAAARAEAGESDSIAEIAEAAKNATNRAESESAGNKDVSHSGSDPTDVSQS